METMLNTGKLESPEVTYSKIKNCVFIIGNSFMERPQPFYKSICTDIIELVHKELQNTEKNINIVFYLEYFNTASSLSILEFLQRLENAFLDSGRVNIFWFEEDDEQVEVIEPEFASMINIPFKFIPVDPDIENIKLFVRAYLY